MRSKFTLSTSQSEWFTVLTRLAVELLDPRWREQKAKADARYATSNVTMADVATNLKRLASQRSDVFDMMTGQDVLEEDAQRRKKMATTHTFDGNPDGVSQAHLNQIQKFNVDEQIARIHQKFATDKK
jgi:splicing factor 3A subunit 1